MCRLLVKLGDTWGYTHALVDTLADTLAVVKAVGDTPGDAHALLKTLAETLAEMEAKILGENRGDTSGLVNNLT